MCMGVDRFGGVAPVIYLGTWLSKNDLLEKEHRKYSPNEEEMRALRSTVRWA